MFGVVVLIVGMLSMWEVMSTKTVKVERMDESITETVPRGKAGVVEVEKTWPYTEECKAILGKLRIRFLI